MLDFPEAYPVREWHILRRDKLPGLRRFSGVVKNFFTLGDEMPTRPAPEGPPDPGKYIAGTGT